MKNNLLFIRKELLHITAEEFARNINISVARYHNYELNRTPIPADVAIKISKRYGYSLDFIYCNINENNNDILNEIKDNMSIIEHTKIKNMINKNVITHIEPLVFKPTINDIKKTYPLNLLSELLDTEVKWKQLIPDQYHGLRYVLSKLQSRERYVIIKKFKYNKTLDKISKEIGVTIERTRQIIGKALLKMKNPCNIYYITDGFSKHTNDLINKRKDEKEKIDNLQKKHQDKPIEMLQLSNRSKNVLKRAKINTVSELIGIIQENKLLKIKNLGKKSYNEIITKIENIK